MSSANPHKIRKYGEVFTPAELVANIINRPELQDYLRDYTRTVLEPAVGDGSFLIQILNQRLHKVVQEALQQPTREAQLAYYESYSLVALSTLYGIEIQADVVAQCRHKLEQLMSNHYQWFVAQHLAHLDMEQVPALWQAQQDWHALQQACQQELAPLEPQLVQLSKTSYHLQVQIVATPQPDPCQPPQPLRTTSSPLQRKLRQVLQSIAHHDGDFSKSDAPRRLVPIAPRGPIKSPLNFNLEADSSDESSSSEYEATPIPNTKTEELELSQLTPALSLPRNYANVAALSNPWYVHALLEFYYLVSAYGQDLHVLCTYPAPAQAQLRAPLTHSPYQRRVPRSSLRANYYHQGAINSTWGWELQRPNQVYAIIPAKYLSQTTPQSKEFTLVSLQLPRQELSSPATYPLQLQLRGDALGEQAAPNLQSSWATTGFLSATLLSQQLFHQHSVLLANTDLTCATQVAQWLQQYHKQLAPSSQQDYKARTQLHAPTWEFTLTSPEVYEVQQPTAAPHSKLASEFSCDYEDLTNLTNLRWGQLIYLRGRGVRGAPDLLSNLHKGSYEPLRIPLQFQALTTGNNTQPQFWNNLITATPHYNWKQIHTIATPVENTVSSLFLTQLLSWAQHLHNLKEWIQSEPQSEPLASEFSCDYEDLTSLTNLRWEQLIYLRGRGVRGAPDLLSNLHKGSYEPLRIPLQFQALTTGNNTQPQFWNNLITATPHYNWKQIHTIATPVENTVSSLFLTQLLSWAQHLHNLKEWIQSEPQREPLISSCARAIKEFKLPEAWLQPWDSASSATATTNLTINSWLEYLQSCVDPHAILTRMAQADTTPDASQLWLDLRQVVAQLTPLELGALVQMIPVASVYQPLTHTAQRLQHLKQLLLYCARQLAQLLLKAGHAVTHEVAPRAYLQYLVSKWESNFTQLCELVCQLTTPELPTLGTLLTQAGLAECLAQLEEWGMAHALAQGNTPALVHVSSRLTSDQLHAQLQHQARLIQLAPHTQACITQLLGKHASLWLHQSQLQLATTPQLATGLHTELFKHLYIQKYQFEPPVGVWENWDDLNQTTTSKRHLLALPAQLTTEHVPTPTFSSANHARATDIALVHASPSSARANIHSSPRPSRTAARAQVARDLEALVQLVQTAQPLQATLSTSTVTPEQVRCNAKSPDTLGVVAPKPSRTRKPQTSPEAATPSMLVAANTSKSASSTPTSAPRKRRKAPAPIDILDHDAPPAPKASFKFIHVPSLVQNQRSTRLERSKTTSATNDTSATQAPLDLKEYQRILNSAALYKRTKEQEELEHNPPPPMKKKDRLRAETPPGFEPEEYRTTKKMLLKRFYDRDGQLRPVKAKRRSPMTTSDTTATVTSTEGRTPKAKRSPRRPLHKRLQAEHPQAKFISLSLSRSGATSSRTTHPALSTRGNKEQESLTQPIPEPALTASQSRSSRPNLTRGTRAKRGKKLLTPHIVQQLELFEHERDYYLEQHLQLNTLAALTSPQRTYALNAEEQIPDATLLSGVAQATSATALYTQATQHAQLLKQYSQDIKQLKIPTPRGRPRGSTKVKAQGIAPELSLKQRQAQLQEHFAERKRGRRPRHIEQAILEVRKQQQQGNAAIHAELAPHPLPECYVARCQELYNEQYFASYREIINANIIHGDFLTGEMLSTPPTQRQHYSQDKDQTEKKLIIFTEWRISDYQCLPLTVLPIEHDYHSLINAREETPDYTHEQRQACVQPLLNRAKLHSTTAQRVRDLPQIAIAHRLLMPIFKSFEKNKQNQAQLAQWLVTYNLCLELAVDPHFTWTHIPVLLSRLALLSPSERQARYAQLRAQREAEWKQQQSHASVHVDAHVNPLTLRADQLEAWEAQQRGRWDAFLTQLAQQTPSAVVAYDCRNRACELLNNRVSKTKTEFLATYAEAYQSPKHFEEQFNAPSEYLNWSKLLDLESYTQKDSFKQVEKIAVADYVKFLRQAEDENALPYPQWGYISVVSQEVVLQCLHQLEHQMLRSGLPFWQQLQVNLADQRAQIQSHMERTTDSNKHNAELKFVSPFIPHDTTYDKENSVKYDWSTHYPRIAFWANIDQARLVASELLHYAWIWDNTRALYAAPQEQQATSKLSSTPLNTWGVSVIMFPELQVSQDKPDEINLGQWTAHQPSSTPVVQPQSRVQLAQHLAQLGNAIQGTPEASSDCLSLEQFLWADAPTYQHLYGAQGVSYANYLNYQQYLSCTRSGERDTRPVQGKARPFTDKIHKIERYDSLPEASAEKRKFMHHYLTQLAINSDIE